MKILLTGMTLMLLCMTNAMAEQAQVVRLHVDSGTFSMANIDSPIGPFVLEAGTYQGDPQDPVNNHIVAWEFSFFGPVYNYTAATNIYYPVDTGGLPPTGSVDTITNTIHMDMSSWFAYWNGTHFNQGSANATGSFDPLTGYFTLSWQKMIVGGAFDGYTGIWQINGFAETDSLSLLIPAVQVDGGDTQECNQYGGTGINAHLSIQNPNNVVVNNISWLLDDVLIATDVMDLQYDLPLGEHILRIDVTADDGTMGTTSQAISINDTQPPLLDLRFIDTRSGNTVNSIDTNSISWIKSNILATDICDPAPVVSGFGGFEVTHGDLLKVQGNNGTVQLTTDRITINANASDASANTTSGLIELLITP